MKSVGELLRDERLRQGLELAEIAERTRINLSFLEAIEAGDTESLPGAFFYRSFVRQYAHALEMDEADLEPTLSELRIQAEASQPLPSPVPASAPIEVPPMPTLTAARRFAGPKPSSLILLVAVIVACGGLYALWQRYHHEEPAIAQPAASVAAESRPEQKPPPAAQEAAPQPAATPAPQVEAPKPAEPAPPPPAVEDARFNIELVASDLVWLSATADGRKTTTVLKEGQDRKSVV
jgi:cytoskeletal protein RodZ